MPEKGIIKAEYPTKKLAVNAASIYSNRRNQDEAD